MHIAVIDLTARGLRFKVTAPGGSLEAVRQTTLGFLNQERAQLAINAHFFLPFPSNDTNANVVGLAASKGKVYSPFEVQPIGVDFTNQSYAIIPFAPALNIRRDNDARIVHRDATRAGNQRVIERVRLWNVISGSAQIVSNGVKTIPAYTGPPEGLRPAGSYSDGDSWYGRVRARTAIGLSANRKTLVLFTVDEAGGSGGMTVGEVADVLIEDYQVWNALNLDGGGSTTLAMQDPETGEGRIVNMPSEGPMGRAVGSNLAVFARPLVPKCDVTVRGDKVIISWPAPSTGWRLQESPDPNFTRWRDVPALPKQVGDRMQVILNQQGPREFYRLRR
jgi:hypothetical protein